MILKSIDKCEVGTKLGKTVHDDNGRPLLMAGVALSTRMIDKLKSYGMTTVYVENEETADIDVEDDVRPEVKRKAVSSVKEAFGNLIASKDKKKQSLFGGEVSFKNFQHVLGDIYSDLKKSDKALNLMSNVQVYDSYVYTHSFNVTTYAVQIAINLGMDEKRVREVGIGSLLHDVGKTKVPTEILNKKGKLTDQEFDIIKSHAQAGYDMLRGEYEISLVSAHCAYQHHERIDGSGYPRGITGDQMHEYAKILAVADVFDAVTSHRVYRPAMLPHEGMELLYAGAGTEFDKKIVEAFRNSIAMYPVGMEVKLSNGDEGVVVDSKKGFAGRPIVRVFTDKDGNKYKEPKTVDLTKTLNLVVKESTTLL